MLVSAGEILGY